MDKNELWEKCENVFDVFDRELEQIENEIEQTCTTEGSHDEVLYCTECGEEVLRTHITTGRPSHQFYNQKCIICGEDQKAKV